MKKLLGPLLLVSCLLVGRLKHSGRFLKSIYDGFEEKQQVKMDIPLPAGLLCSTLAKGTLHEQHFMLHLTSNRVGWDNRKDYTYPVVLGDYRYYREFVKEMQNFKISE